jgi:hypothetical protein
MSAMLMRQTKRWRYGAIRGEPRSRWRLRDELKDYQCSVAAWQPLRAGRSRSAAARTEKPRAAKSLTEEQPLTWQEVQLPETDLPPLKPPAQAVAAVVRSISGSTAVCLVNIAGVVIPVDLPAEVLRFHGLTRGQRFLWWMSEDGSITRQDIDPLSEPVLSPQQQEQGRRLFAKLQDDLAAGRVWQGYEGDGP